MIKTAIRKAAMHYGYEISRIPSGSSQLIRPEATYAPWAADTEFQLVFGEVRPNTMVDVYRCYELWTLVEQVSHISGDIIEIGVWRGGSGALLAKRAQMLSVDARVYLCDTFRGMVKTGPQDPLYKGGELADTSADTARSLVRNMELSNVTVLEGVFPEESAHLVASHTIRLCHIDVDVYQSAKDVLDWVWPKLPVGGLLVYDDYGFPTCAGVTRHVDEQRQLTDRVVIHNLNGHAIIIKTR